MVNTYFSNVLTSLAVTILGPKVTIFNGDCSHFEGVHLEIAYHPFG